MKTQNDRADQGELHIATCNHISDSYKRLVDCKLVCGNSCIAVDKYSIDRL